MKLAISFTNFGPYHLARLRAAAKALREVGGELVAIEVAGRERLYPWETGQRSEPFEWVTLFPNRDVEDLSTAECRQAMRTQLDASAPDALAVVGYARPESMAMLEWAERHDAARILLSESQAVDRRRTWWRERVKSWRVRRFDAALVGGPPHRDYLVALGMPPDRIELGYNAVDHEGFRAAAEDALKDANSRAGLPARPYFLSVSRFAPEKNLLRLIEAFAAYRHEAPVDQAWDLVLCGGGPQEAEIRQAIEGSGFADAIHTPGFLQVDELPRWYAQAGAFVLASVSEPWGLVVNEAAACATPLLVSDRVGAAFTLVPEPGGITGRRFDPLDPDEMAGAFAWMAGLPVTERAAMGQRAEHLASQWGPTRFAEGLLKALGIATGKVAATNAQARRETPVGC